MIFRLVSLIAKRTSSLLLLSFFSLCIGGFLFGAVLTFTTSINTFLISEGKTLIGGDVIFSSPYPIDTNAEVFTSLKQEGHTVVEARSFQGVFSTESSSSPAAIRAVSGAFPLYGKVELRDSVSFEYSPGALYAEESFLNRLSLSVGDTVEFAGKMFTVKGVLLKEPDTISVGVAFAPKVLVFLSDVETITVPLSESRTRYRVYVRENVDSPLLTTTREGLKQYATDNRLRFDDALDGPNNLLEGFSSIDDFVGVVLAVALFLVVINIGANLVYLLSRFRKTIALLKIYGALAKTIEKVFLIIFGVMGFIAGVIGAVAGIYVAQYVLEVVNGIYRISLLSNNFTLITVLGGVFGSLFIMLAALPFLYLVKKVEPKELLLNQAPTQKSFSASLLIRYLPVPLFVGATLYFISRNILVSVGGVLVCIFVFMLFMAVVFLLLKLAYQVRGRFSFTLRSIISFLYLRKIETLVSVAAIMTAFSLVFLVTAVKHNLELNLRTNISASAPSMYLVDITASQLPQIRELAGESFKEYPIVRGRLLYFNDRDLLQEDNRELRREFNLTYRDTLIDGEVLTKGVLGDTLGGTVSVPVSIDTSFGEELGGVDIGDTIEIFIQGIQLKATITSIREVDSTSGTPFFYLVFPTEILASFPASFFGTVQATDEERKEIELAIAKLFPNVIPIVTASILTAVTELVESIVTVVALVSIPSIILGLLLIVVMLSQNMYERSGDVLVLRAFGLSRRRVTVLFLLEGVLLVFLAGALSYVIAHLVAFGLNVFLFSFDSFGFVFSPLYMIIGNMLFIALVSYLLSLRVSKASLKRLLAEK
jgi:putative ABC transport system permease protein